MSNEQIRMETINVDSINSHQNPVNRFDTSTVETLDLDNITLTPLSNEQIYQAGYDYFLSNREGAIPENIEWNTETQECWERGMQDAERSGILYNEWVNHGYNFVSQGQAMPDTNNFNAYIVNAMQQGMTQALEEGNVVDPASIPKLQVQYQDATPQQQLLEDYRRLLNENWYNQGVESLNNLSYFNNRDTSSSLDSSFRMRDVPISASDIINAGRISAFNSSNSNNSTNNNNN